MDKRLIWIGLGAMALILRYVATPTQIEHIYSRGLFLWVRRLLDVSITNLPLPLFYVFYILLIIWLIYLIRKTPWKQLFSWKILFDKLISFCAFAGAVLFLFFFLWGFNYGRIPLVKQVGLEPKPASFEELYSELMEVTEVVIEARKDIDDSSIQPIDAHRLPIDMERLCRDVVEEVLIELGYPVAGCVRGRVLFTKGILLRFGSSGVYWPFVGEGNIDGGLHPIQQPFILCHELFHGYGITNEGVCNFLAYLATQKSDNTFIKYSGQLSYWRYLAIEFQKFNVETYQQFRAELPLGLQADLDEINIYLDNYPDLFPRLRYVAYDSYLKSQGITEGMKSYSSIIMLVRSWKERQRG